MDDLRKLVERLQQPQSLSMYAGPNDMALALLEERAEILAALAAIPEGWVLVPREATDEMISAGVFAHRNDGYRGMPMHAAWAAMVAASPPLAASRAEQEPQP